MEHFICRCKHCGALYTYCTYGNDYCTKEYCNTCAQAIFNTLKKIPVKFHGAKQRIIDPIEISKIVEIFDEEKSKYYNSENCRVCKMTHDWGYETVEECYIDGVEYFRCTDANSHIDIYVNAEYDSIEKKFTGKYYFDNDNPKRKYFPLSQLKFGNVFKVQPLKEPEGKLFYNDFLSDIEWEITPIDKDK